MTGNQTWFHVGQSTGIIDSTTVERIRSFLMIMRRALQRQVGDREEHWEAGQSRCQSVGRHDEESMGWPGLQGVVRVFVVA